MIPTNESPVVITDRVQSTNYDPPDGSEIFADAGTNLDLDTGTFTSTGLTIDGETGDLNIRGNVDATTFTTEEIESRNYEGPDPGEIFSDAGTNLDLDTGTFTSTGLTIDGETGDLNIRGNVDATTFTTEEIESRNYEGPDPGEIFSDAGTRIDLINGDILSESFRLNSPPRGEAYFEGNVVARGFDLLINPDPSNPVSNAREVAEIRGLGGGRVGIVSEDENGGDHNVLVWDTESDGGPTTISAPPGSGGISDLEVGNTYFRITLNGRIMFTISRTSNRVTITPSTVTGQTGGADSIPSGQDRILEVLSDGTLRASVSQTANLVSRIQTIETRLGITP